MVFDKETGKPKGYGFCEYKDSATALSAMRNLNGFDMNGRSLRVDFAEKGLDDKELSQMNAGVDFGSGSASNPTNPVVGIQSEITKLVEGMSHNQLYEIIYQMKLLIQKNPDHVRHLLTHNPQLAFALLQAQVTLGTISSEVAKKVLVPVEKTTSPREPPPAMPPSRPPLHPMGGMPPMSHPLMPVLPMNAPGGYPPYQNPGYPPNVYHPSPAPLADSLDVLPEDQRQLLEHVMSLSQEAIEKLAPQERNQILQLRHTMMQLYLPQNRY
uniref:RRM domain-containing protein n=1 Tax=Arcella intermedia TaxID=1963864 RepID=A0A6B2LAV0_9EUKA